jgi:ribosome recycling factor
MSDEFFLDTDDLQRRMDGAMGALKTEFASLRTGRASASMLEPITVEALWPAHTDQSGWHRQRA